jgi:hypothetical protein
MNYKNFYNSYKGWEFIEREYYTILRMCYNIPTFGRGEKLKMENGKLENYHMRHNRSHRKGSIRI